MTFTGFGEQSIDFWEGLAADNTKAYWHAHKDTYDTAIGQPLCELGEALEAEFGQLHRYRPTATFDSAPTDGPTRNSAPRPRPAVTVPALCSTSG